MLTETSVTFSSSVEHSHMSTRISMIGRLAIALLDVLFRFIMQECKGTRVTLRNKAPRQPLWQNEYFRSRSTSRFQGILDDIVENWKSWKFFSSGESRRKSCDATTMTRWISDISHACSNHAYYMIDRTGIAFRKRWRFLLRFLPVDWLDCFRISHDWNVLLLLIVAIFREILLMNARLEIRCVRLNFTLEPSPVNAYLFPPKR